MKKKLKAKSYDAELLKQVIDLEKENNRLKIDLDYHKEVNNEITKKLDKIFEILYDGCGY